MLVLTNTDIYNEKESLYYKVREKEGRIISDAALLQLPYVAAGHPYKKEWDQRAANYERFLSYLQKRFDNKTIKILDVGCGNGWMTHRLHEAGYNLTGIDLNMEELTQAERAFGTDKDMQWIYADIMTDKLPSPVYDVVIFGASCQYFADINALTQRLTSMLAPKGEIHLLDSVFYNLSDKAAAATRSNAYYSGLGFPVMSSYYHHHTVEELKKTGYTRVYPKWFHKASPLQWWRFIKS